MEDNLIETNRLRGPGGGDFAELDARRGHEVTIGPLVLTDLWTRATPPGAPTGAGYLTIANPSDQPDGCLRSRAALRRAPGCMR